MRYHLGIATAVITSLMGCDYNKPADYQPKKDYKAFQAAEIKAQELAKASKETASPAQLAAAEAGKNYQTYCSSCHGQDGKANTPTAKALKPMPRNLTDKQWQASVDDARIYKVIKEGGASVGLSASMAPWGGALDDKKIKGLVSYIRTLAK